MTQDARRPLHRLTPLHDDPAAAWLSPPQRTRVADDRRFIWLLFVIFLAAAFWWARSLLRGPLASFSRAYACRCLAPSMVGCRARRGRRAALVMAPQERQVAAAGQRQRAGRSASPIDDFNDLEQQPDGSGRVDRGLDSRPPAARRSGRRRAVHRPRARLPAKVSRACSKRSTTSIWSTRRETPLLVQVAGARMLGDVERQPHRRQRAASCWSRRSTCRWGRWRPAGTPSCCGTAIR